MFGAVRHHGEIDEFRSYLTPKPRKIAVAISPSDVEDELRYNDSFLGKIMEMR